LHDSVCFHCQQCVEKHLKALLEERGRTVPKTNSLDDVLNLLVPDYPTFHSFRRGLIALTRYALDPYYAGGSTTKRQAAAALRWMQKVRTAARDSLGIRPQAKKQK
jgi:HEPN domain-containing protein